MSLPPDYVCALSGLLPADDSQIDEDHADERLGYLPVGWTEVRLRRRVPNPAWLEIQAVKDAMVAQELQKVPKKHRKNATRVVQIQIEAMFGALEARTPTFIVDEEVTWVAPSHREEDAQGLTEAQLQVWDALEIDWLDTDDMPVQAAPEVAPVEVPVETMPESPEDSVEAPVVVEEVEAPAPSADESTEASAPA